MTEAAVPAVRNAWRRKGVDAARDGAGNRLKPTLSWPHLVALGVGAIVGTGIYTLTGVGAGLAFSGVAAFLAARRSKKPMRRAKRTLSRPPADFVNPRQ